MSIRLSTSSFWASPYVSANNLRLFKFKFTYVSLFWFLGEACTIVLRGATQQIIDEAERSLHDALCVLAQTVKDTRTVYGGGEYSNFEIYIFFNAKIMYLLTLAKIWFFKFSGCSEMLMANAVWELAKRTPGKESLAMESFAKALSTVSSCPVNCVRNKYIKLKDMEKTSWLAFWMF